MRSADTGTLSAAMIIDFHTHILPPAFIKDRSRYLKADATLRSLFAPPRSPMATAGELLAAMDEAGVDVAVIMGMGWTSQEVARVTSSVVALVATPSVVSLEFAERVILSVSEESGEG
ncbi:MAG: hypothetical protein HY531_01845 [Chloroflexi bacterium]|nr:hypothetical protein [Chloroflexota bacterium]